MPNSSNPLNLVVSAMLAFIALPFVMIGLVGLVHVDELWWAYALLLGAGGLMVAGAVTTVRRWQKALGEEVGRSGRWSRRRSSVSKARRSPRRSPRRRPR